VKHWDNHQRELSEQSTRLVVESTQLARVGLRLLAQTKLAEALRLRELLNRSGVGSIDGTNISLSDLER
jgi:hypothetical protein